MTHLVAHVLAELRTAQALASQVVPAEHARPMLPQGPFPPASAFPLLQQRSALQGASQGSSAIHKDLQRMFARKISFSSAAFLGGGSHRPTVGGMLTHMVKLTLKTMVEEARTCTFSRDGFQQLHLDCAMLRWVLPACVDDEGAALSLLDELLISCQERTLEPAPLEHSVLERLCDAKRKELLLALA